MNFNKKHRGERDSKPNFMLGVLVLSFSTILVKVIGLAYKIPMIAYLGAEGMGYFNSAYEIYAILCVISTAGLPVALSMLISAQKERGGYGELRRIDRSALWLFFCFGALGTAILVVFAEPIAVGIGNPRAQSCIIAIAPALLSVCLSSAVRGYYQGLNRMTPTAVSQLIEAVGKLGFGLWFAYIGLKQGRTIPEVAALAVWGLTLGTALSALYLFLLKVTDGENHQMRRHAEEKNGLCTENHPLRTLIKIAIPITLGSAVLSMTRLVDMALILRRLQEIGVSVSEANRVYGSYTTLAIPIFSLIPALITPISLALVPSLSGAIENQRLEDQEEIADRSVRLTVLLSLPASVGITVYAKPILSLLFKGQYEAIAIASPLLALLGLSVLFSGLITTTNAILQSYRQTVKPILSMAIGAFVKLVSAYILIGMPSVGVLGAPISTFFCNVIITVLNFFFMGRCVPDTRKRSSFFHMFGKPLLASVLGIFVSFGGYGLVMRLTGIESLAFLAAVSLMVVGYGILVVLMRMLTDEDIAMLPMGKHLLRLRKKNPTQSNLHI